jgi:hypothetical protein
MALIRVDGVGVGQYDARTGRIEAEDYFNASGTSKTELNNGNFAVSSIDDGDYLVYPNINGLEEKTKIKFEASNLKKLTLEVRKDSPEGELLASYRFKGPGGRNDSNVFDFPQQESKASVCFVFRGEEDNLMILDSFSFN